MSDFVKRLKHTVLYTGGGEASDLPEAAAEIIVALRSLLKEERDDAASEIERLRAALREIVDLTERPADLYPADWKEQIAACPDCQRYKDHPIQRGICDTHRKPIYATEDHNRHETRILGDRAKDIARAALESHQSRAEGREA